jgi:hypothetical protein
MLSALNDLNCFEHEGDWEGVTAVTARDDPQRLEFVAFAAHEEVLRYPVSELEMEGQRARVYVASGTHAAYRRACPSNCNQVFRRVAGLPVPEDDIDGAEPWARNPEAACDQAADPCLLPLESARWSSFSGFWGSLECTTSRGSCRLATPPVSPRAQVRFRIPWCHMRLTTRKLTCDQ